MTDILDLKGWTVLGRTEEDGADVLEAEYPLPMPTAGLVNLTPYWRSESW